MKKTLVISAFPASGKTHCFNDIFVKRRWEVLDSDSSQFSWIKDENGNNTKERNLDFPNNYMKHIKDNIGKVDVIFVSSHDNVRKALEAEKIPYYLVYPYNDEGNYNKALWIQRMRHRGSTQDFCDFIYKNWDNFIEDMMMETWPTHIILDVSGENKEANGPYISFQLLDNLFTCEDTNEEMF